jgi:tetratricopeptide (TPR) repeat protein
VSGQRGRGLLLAGTALGTLASFVLSAVAGDVLSQVLTAGGRLGLLLTAIAAIAWLAIRIPTWRQRLRERRSRSREGLVAIPVGQRVPRSLTTDAEQAERWLVALGSDTSGLAAAEWFGQEGARLHALVKRYATNPAAVDPLARICDALDAWYVQRRRPDALLDLAERLAALADHAMRRDLKEVAAARAATAHRMAGDLDAATRELGRSAGLAARGPTAAAVRARREVEWALSNLARADHARPGADQEEHLASAHDRLVDAAAALPPADLAGDTAIHLDLGVVALYRRQDGTALDHFGRALNRAIAAHDVSTEAHSHELAGVVSWAQKNPLEAIAWWRRARRLYADVGDREGEARCLQHLGSAALRSRLVAGKLRRDDEPVDAVPLRLLQASAALRGGAHGHPVLEHYLGLAGGGPEDTPTEPVRIPESLRRAWRRFTRRGARPDPPRERRA